MLVRGVLCYLLSFLSNALICRQVLHVRILKPCNSAAFLMKSFLHELIELPSSKSTSSLMWLGLVPPRMDAFCWLVSGNVSTDNLRRKSLLTEAISFVCLLCGKFREMVDHLFIHWEFSYALWCRFIAMSKVLWCFQGLWGFLLRLGSGALSFFLLFFFFFFVFMFCDNASV